MNLRKTQAKEMLSTLSAMSTQEAIECKTHIDASTQALRTYYQQEGTSSYNLNEALDAIVTLIDRSQKTVHAEQQKRFLELSNRPTIALYMGFPEQLIPAEIKNQRHQPFLPPLGKGVNPDPPRGSKKSKDKLSDNKKETQSGLQGTLNEERQPQSREYQENIGTSESLMFFHELCNIENNMLALFNKLNDIEYTSGIVNLSKYTLQDPEISVLSKGLGFCPTPGHQT